MKKGIKKSLGITLAMVLSLGALTACGGAKDPADDKKETESSVVKETEKETETSETEQIPEKDMGGMVVTIASWADVVEPEEKANAQEEELWNYRHEMMDKWNFGFEEKAIVQWNTSLEQFSTSTMAGTPEAEIFRFHTNFVLGAMNSELAYDLATLDSIDLKDPKWNQSAIEVMTRGDSVYGIATNAEPRLGLYYNKRLFEEAGLDPELLYDLQASGEWTWEKFEEISEKVTRDIDNDGVSDVYAINASASEFYKIVVLSNNGKYVDIDENGKYVNASTSPETMEALQWATDYFAKDYDLYPESWETTYQEQLFTNGKVAMTIADRWKTMIWKDMEDDFGFVCFPKGPKADNYSVMSNDEIWVIPNTYSKEEAENIISALDVWANPAPGYTAEEAFMTTQYPLFRDDRAVDETLALMREPGVAKIDFCNIIPEVTTNAFADDLYWNGVTPTQALESKKGEWEAAIEAANK